MAMELRYNPLIGEWIMVSSVREARPWQPSDRCPFDEGNEETGTGWRFLILPNKFPMLSPNAPKAHNVDGFKARRSLGYCMVIVESPKHDLKDLHEIPLDDLTLVLKGVRDEMAKLEGSGFVKYIYFFRNKGKEIGVSLTHPHSQMYALPYVPLRIRLELRNMRRYMRRTGKCLLCSILDEEVKLGERVLYTNGEFYVVKPYYSMWPYEVHVIPRRHVQKMTQLTNDELVKLADALRVTTAMLDNVLGRDMPYIMAFHQAPVKSDESYHMHVEFYPMLRDASKLKYAAGVEWGLWTFTYDSLPEDKARELRETCHKIAPTLNPLGSCT